MKIIWITSLFPSGSDSTKGIYLYRTVKALSKYYDITVLCIFPAVPPLLTMIKKPFEAIKTYKYWHKNYPKKPIAPKDLDPSSVHYVRYWRMPRFLFNHLEGYFAYFKVKKIMDGLITKDTILHSNWIFPSGQLTKIIAKKYKIPYTVSLRGGDVHNLKHSSNYWYFAKEVLDNAKIICSVSHKLIEKCREEKIQVNANNVIYISNIYDENIFTIKDKNKARKELNLTGEDKIILYAGGLTDIKNVDTLIKAFSEILKIEHNYKLFISGAGFKENYLKKLVVQLGVNDNISFLGNLRQEDLINYMNAANVLCLPSKNEGMPNVIIESLLCGTPVVASNVGGIPTIVKQGENGYLFEPTIINNLKNLLLVSLKRNWDRENLRRSVRRFYSSEVIIGYHELYKRLAI